MLTISATAASAHHPDKSDTDLLATGLSGGSSSVGPDGALSVAEPLANEISRVDRRSDALPSPACRSTW